MLKGKIQSLPAIMVIVLFLVTLSVISEGVAEQEHNQREEIQYDGGEEAESKQKGIRQQSTGQQRKLGQDFGERSQEHGIKPIRTPGPSQEPGKSKDPGKSKEPFPDAEAPGVGAE